MKERGILFSAAMVRAILAGAKTQTRRVVKLPYTPDAIEEAAYPGEWQPWLHSEQHATILCPYGQPGDRLWVRETHLIVGGPESGRVVYKATNDGPDAWIDPSWRCSIHMPRWASRITLEITGVRVERLQDISEADCLAEGVESTDFWAEAERLEPATGANAARYAYRALWESIGGPGSWDANPWVWCISFRRIR